MPRTLAALVGLLAVADPAAAEKPTKVEIARRGKAAVALLEVTAGPNKRYGPAFCVHPSGVFVAARLTLHGAEVPGVPGAPAAPPPVPKLVLDPGQPTQRAVGAAAFREDKELGLVVLRAERVAGLPHLKFGPTDRLTELAEVISLGFAQYPRDAVDEYPSVTVTVGTVASLRRVGGKLARIDVNPAAYNVGGPVLDDTGRLVGAFSFAGVGGAGGAAPPSGSPPCWPRRGSSSRRPS